MDKQTKPTHFYQKSPTWIALSFLSGATVMVAALGILVSPSAVSNQASGTVASRSPYSTSLAASPSSSLPISVTIFSPGDGQAFSSTSTITIAATAQAKAGIGSMALWVDDQLVKTCLAAACSINLPASSLPTRSVHTLKAIAADSSGLNASALVNFYVLP
jgi:hypothetical protein